MGIAHEGRIEARSKGVKFGRKPTVNHSKIIALKSQGVRASNIAKQLGIGRSTVYKTLKQND